MTTRDPVLRRLANAVLVPGSSDPALPDWLGRELAAGLGGICWFGNEPGGLAAAVHGINAGALILSDEEGGGVTRLESATGSSWPGNAALGAVDDPDITEQVAAGIAARAAAAGIDVALAPIVDVNADPENPVIGVRSFGADPTLVSRHGAAFVRGVQSQGVAACAKHFPGHGNTHTDSHFALAFVSDDVETIRRRDLAPFAAAVSAGVRCVMTAHVVFPAVDDVPATTSHRWLTAMLRDELGFDGVVISDALDMQAIAGGIGRGAGAVAALAAGVDLVCIGNPGFPESYDNETVLAEVRDAIVAAVVDGSLAAARLEAAGERLAALTSWISSARATTSRQPPSPAFGGEVARRAVRSDGDVRITSTPLVIVDERVNMAEGRIGSSQIATELVRRFPDADLVRADAADVGRAVTTGRPVVIVTDGLGEGAAWRAVRAQRADAVVLHTGPLPSAIPPPVVHSLGPGPANAAAAVDLVAGSGDH